MKQNKPVFTLGPQIQPHHHKIADIFIRAEKKREELAKKEQPNKPA